MQFAQRERSTSCDVLKIRHVTSIKTLIANGLITCVKNYQTRLVQSTRVKKGQFSHIRKADTQNRVVCNNVFQFA